MSNSNNLTGYMSGDGGSALSAFPENPSTQDGVGVLRTCSLVTQRPLTAIQVGLLPFGGV